MCLHILVLVKIEQNNGPFTRRPAYVSMRGSDKVVDSQPGIPHTQPRGESSDGVITQLDDPTHDRVIYLRQLLTSMASFGKVKDHYLMAQTSSHY
jgi:hypothetical protein